MIKRRLLGSSALHSLALAGIALGLSSPALAQETEEESVAGAAAEEDDAVIVVTGSRIGGLTAFNSPDPLTIVDPEIAIKEGRFDTASMLQSSPIAAGSTQITSALSSNFVTNGGPGAQTND
jgi:iron complex outermembrane receptor protein